MYISFVLLSDSCIPSLLSSVLSIFLCQSHVLPDFIEMPLYCCCVVIMNIPFGTLISEAWVPLQVSSLDCLQIGAFCREENGGMVKLVEFSCTYAIHRCFVQCGLCIKGGFYLVVLMMWMCLWCLQWRFVTSCLFGPSTLGEQFIHCTQYGHLFGQKLCHNHITQFANCYQVIVDVWYSVIGVWFWQNARKV